MSERESLFEFRLGKGWASIRASKTRRKRDPGRCYRKAGFRHVGFTQGGLWVFQMLEDEMPAALPLWETEAAA